LAEIVACSFLICKGWVKERPDQPTNPNQIWKMDMTNSTLNVNGQYKIGINGHEKSSTFN